MFRYNLAAAVLLLAAPAFANPPTPVSLSPIAHNDATLVVASPDGTETRYAPVELEELPTYRMETTTPWRDAPAVFEGVLLRDLLARNGLSGVASIRVTAENEFTSIIPRAVWEETDMMVVTRVDGAPHSRRARGPIQFVVDAATYANSGVVAESHLVWMAARIDVAD